VLISTGTWAISLNPFNYAPLTTWELQKDCLCFLSYKQKPVKASRFFAGNEHDENEKRIATHFNRRNKYYDTVLYNGQLVKDLSNQFKQDDREEFESGPCKFSSRDLNDFTSYEEAYHQLMMDIIYMQVLSTDLVLHETEIRKIFVDGGFSKNQIYMNLLSRAYKDYEVYSASVAQASAIGAALALHTGTIPPNLITTHLQKPPSL
jgi:hypothetical protein